MPCRAPLQPAETPGQAHLERQALDVVREMLFRGESGWKQSALGWFGYANFDVRKVPFLLQSASFDGVFGVFLPENGGLCLPIGKQVIFVTH